MNSLKEQVLELFKFCGELYDIDIESELAKNDTRRSGTIGRMSDENDMFTIYNNIQCNELEIAYTQLNRMVSYKLSNAMVNSDDLVSTMQNAIVTYQRAIPIIKKYVAWEAENTIKFREYLFNNNWLKDEEKTDKLLKDFNWLWIAKAKKSIHKGYIKTYSTTECTHISELVGLPYKMPDVLVITSSPINIKPNPKLDDSEMVHVTMYMKIEDIIDYSYFIITYQYRGEMYIATDKMNFSNPRVASCSRNPRGRRESTYDNVDLPYGIIDDIITWRKESKDITKMPGQEIYIKQISEYLPVGAKVCLRLLIEELLYNVIPYYGELPKIGYVSEQKLIGDGKTSNPFRQYEYDKIDRFFSEYVLPESTAITIAPKSELVLKHVKSDWLATPTEAVNLAIWAEKEESRKQKQELLDVDGAEFEAQKKAFNILLKSHKERLLEIALSGDEVFTYFIDVEPQRWDFTKEKVSTVINNFCSSVLLKDIWCSSSIHAHTGTGYTPHYKNLDCTECKLHESKGQVRINMTTYKQLVAILGIDRKELPFIIQNYNANTHRPYIGNSILDNINPEFLLIDRLSKEHPNRYAIGFNLCKQCFNKLSNKYRRFNRSLVLLSYNNKCVVDIVDYDEFLKENPHLNAISQGYL